MGYVFLFLGVTTRVTLSAISFLLLMAKKDEVYPERSRRASIVNALVCQRKFYALSRYLPEKKYLQQVF